MSNTIILKKSAVTGNAPASGDLSLGEIAINYADGHLYYKSGASATPVKINAGDADTVDGFHLNQDVRSTASPTFAGLTANLSSEGTYFTGGSGGVRQLSITSGTNISAHALHTFNIASSNGKYEFDVNGTTELSLDSSSATFAGSITTGGTNATVKADRFSGTGTGVVVGPNSNGTVFLRPAGVGSTTSQSSFTGTLATIGTNATVTGNVTATTFYGDGSNLTNLPSGADNTKLPLTGGDLTGPLSISNSSGNTLTLKKGTGTPSIALAGTSSEASALIEGIAGGGLKLYTSNGGTLSSPSWSPKMTVLAGGRVGIGTTTPDASTLLHVQGVIGTTNGSAAAPTHSFYGDPDNGMFRAAVNTLGFSTAGTERMRINGAGDVLMGNTAVNIASNFTNQKGFGFKFSTGQTEIATTADIAALTLGRNLGSDGAILDLRKEGTVIGSFGSNTTGGQTLLDISASTSNGNMRFLTSGAERMRINSSGNITLGTASVAAANAAADDLHLKSSGSNGITISSGNAQTGTIFFGDAASSAAAGFRYNHNTGDMAISAEDNITFAADNVGIGTTSPAVDLEIKTANNNNSDEEGLRLYNAGGGVGAGVRIGLGVGATYAEKGHIRTDIVSGGAGRLFLGSNGTDRLVINENGNVGIGTTSPGAYKLNVAGGGRFSANVDFANNFGIRGIKTDSSAIFITRINSSNELVINENANTTVPTRIIGDYITLEPTNFLGVAAEAVRIIDGGNVGIGTSAPEDKLDIVGQLRISDNKTANTNKTNRIRGEHYNIAEEPNTFMFMNSFSTTNTLNIGGGSSIENAATQLNFYTAANNTTTTGSARMSITSAGKVGIGTTSPVAKFEVTDGSSSITLQEYSNGAAIFLDGVNGDFTGGDYFHILANSNSYLGLGGYGGGATPLNISNVGKVGIGTTSPATRLYVKETGAANTAIFENSGQAYSFAAIKVAEAQNNKAVLSFAVGNALASTDIFGEINGIVTNNGGALTGDLYFKTNQGDNMQERMRILANGNVGIGTTSPIDPLNVQSTGASDYAFRIFRSTSTTQGLAGFYEGSANQGQLWLLKGDNSAGVLVNSDGDTYFNGGNVGIGTSSPSYKLSINGSAGIESSEQYLYFHSSASVGSNARAKIRAVGAGGGSGYGGDLRISTRQTNNVWNEDAVIVDSSGRVGIGTTSPAEKLEVTGDIFINGGPAGGRSLALKRTGATNTWKLVQGHTGVDYLEILEGSNTRFLIKNGGNVGIGTTSPDTSLTIKTGSSAGLAKISSDGNGAAYSANGDVQFYTNNSAYAINFFSANKAGNLMRITDSGNVGIGTTTPSAKLEVNGHFAATTKSFIIDNPKTDGRLQYGVVETDEHSVYVRGKSDQEEIQLPEEWEWLVHEDSVTALVTAVGQTQRLFVIEETNKKITVGGLADGGRYNYVVYGTRKDVDALEKHLK